jgi:hypothetical protein
VKDHPISALVAILLFCVAMAIAVSFAGCKSDPTMAPPIAYGKCVVNQYRGSVSANLDCTYSGYRYACVEDDKGIMWCKLVGEASGERSSIDPAGFKEKIK